MPKLRGPHRGVSERSGSLGRVVTLWAPLLCLLAALAGCGTPTVKADCDQLLKDGKNQEVLKDCKDPYQRASAYLALGGFDLNKLLNSSAPAGDVVTLLGLTTSNITTRRKYIEGAVSEVNPPDGNAQAFALLLSSFLGLGVTTEEYLDLNLDGTISQSETKSVLGAVGARSVVVTTGPTTPYFSVVHGGKPYLLDCTADAVSPVCTHLTTKVFDDPDGSGRLTSAIASGPESADKNQVLTGLSSASAVSYPIELLVGSPPFTFSTSATQVLPDFLGTGTPTSQFRHGIAGYLGLISSTTSALSTSGGTPGGTTVSNNVDALVSEFDNGAACFPSTVSQYLGALMTMYLAAAGTPLNPVPTGAGNAYFMNKNIVPDTIKASLDAAFAAFFPVIPHVPQIPAPPGGTSYGFPNGAVSNYKIFYSTLAVVVPPPPPFVFAPDTGTPRVDLAYSPFATEFNATPVFVPNSARDGNESILELLCVDAGKPPTGLAVTVFGGQVLLSWNTVSGATGYTVYRNTSPGVTQNNGSTAFPSATNSFTDATVVHGTKYYYVVTSTNSVGEGGISQEVSAQP